MKDIPVILICYNRPWHTAQVLKTLLEHNIQSLYIFSDAPKSEKDVEAVQTTRKLFNAVRWTKPEIIERTENVGLAKNIVNAVNHVFQKHDNLILLEDDCVPRKYFFDFMYKCLSKYQNHEKIFGINGHSVPIPHALQKNYPYDIYFFPRIGSWGWATWKRAWQHHNPDLTKLYNAVLDSGIDINQGGSDIPGMVQRFIAGQLKDVWTLNWVLSVYLNHGYYIYPIHSQIDNIGLDGTGVHCVKTTKFSNPDIDIELKRLPDRIIINEHLIDNYNNYFGNPKKTQKPPVYTRINAQCFQSASSTKSKTGHTKLNMLNLGCGNHYHLDWTNIDFQSRGTDVIAFDLNKPLPFEDESFDVVYHSHLLEHFPHSRAPVFTGECFRILKPGGIIRVVVPDLEQIARWYLKMFEKSMQGVKDAQERYEWIMLEFFDQMVRNVSGGEMLNYWKQDTIPAEDFVIERVGSEVKNVLNKIRQNAGAATATMPQTYNKNIALDPYQIGRFRLSGEIHQWMYDRYSLGKLLKQAGFREVRVCRADESMIANFNSYLLDIEPDGSVRKPDSLFMEGRR